MQELLNHPAVQGGLAPFVVALIVAELLQRLRLSGLAIVAGFAITVYLVSDFSIEPLTAVRKIVMLGLVSAALGVLSGYIKKGWVRPLLAVAGGLVSIWVAQRILEQREVAAVVLLGAGCMLYVGWLVYWMDGLGEEPVRASSAGLALGLGSGGAALFGASALLGQFGLALGAAAGATLLIQMIANAPLPCGRSFTLPLSLVAGLSACLAVLTAQQPWYTLVALAMIPLAARCPVPAKQPLWVQSLLLSGLAIACGVVAVYLTWRVAGAPPL